VQLKLLANTLEKEAKEIRNKRRTDLGRRLGRWRRREERPDIPARNDAEM
jgi:hypothetical protein